MAVNIDPLENFPNFTLPVEYLPFVSFKQLENARPYYVFTKRLEDPFSPGYFIIPGYSAYSLSRDGDLICRRTGSVKRYYQVAGRVEKNITGGYWNSPGLVRDTGGMQPVGRHRLLMLTFGDCPGHPDNYWVNHKDGVPGNDDLANLEWVTPGENVLHAYRTGLHANKVRSVDLWNHLTGEQLRVDSVALAVEHTGLSHSLITARLNVPEQNGRLHADGWRFKDVGESWRELHTHANLTSNEQAVLAKHVPTGVVTRYPSYRACAQALGFKWPTVQMHCLRSTLKPFRGYLFRKDGDDVQWPTVNPEYVGGRSTFIYVITHVSTGDTLWSGTVSDLVKGTGLHPLLVSRSCASGKVRGDWKFLRESVLSNFESPAA